MKQKIGFKPDTKSYSIENEVKLLKEALEKNNFMIDELFFKNLKEGDIVEIYQYPQNLQLYCNSEFGKLCSYTQEQLQKNPFPSLYWREDKVNQDLVKRAGEVVTQGNKAESWGLGNHELVETLHPKKRTFEIELGWIAPCFDKNSKERKGFVTTQRAVFIFEWQENIT